DAAAGSAFGRALGAAGVFAADAAVFVRPDGFAAGAFAAPAGVLPAFGAVADLGPRAAPGFAAPTVEGEPEGRDLALAALAAASPVPAAVAATGFVALGVALAAGVAG